MALIKCNECGNKISEHSEVCPHCGCPTSMSKKPVLSEENPKYIRYDNFLLRVGGVILDFKKNWKIRPSMDAVCIISLYDNSNVVFQTLPIVLIENNRNQLKSWQVKYQYDVIGIEKINQKCIEELTVWHPSKLTFELRINGANGFKYSCIFDEDGTYIGGDGPFSLDAFEEFVNSCLLKVEDSLHKGLSTMLQKAFEISQNLQENNFLDAFLIFAYKKSYGNNSLRFSVPFSLQFLNASEGKLSTTGKEQKGFIIYFEIKKETEEIFKNKIKPQYPQFKIQEYYTERTVATGRKVLVPTFDNSGIAIDDETKRVQDCHKYGTAEIGFDIPKAIEILEYMAREISPGNSFDFQLVFTEPTHYYPSFIHAKFYVNSKVAKGEAKVEFDYNGNYISSEGFINSENIIQCVESELLSLQEQQKKKDEEIEEQHQKWLNKVYTDSAIFAFFLSFFVTPIAYAFVWMFFKSPMVTDNWIATCIGLYVIVFIALFAFKQYEIKTS